ncbi:MAG: single-stranded DNA-binding protein [Rhodospirillaceae bacterium]|nr:single-stranded DNA-binding protein [Rhodospirillaceae bacterium]|tara:strand:- start:500 stop:871 length:372 start_codon:yes stop_codon:yes gene_type:complete
MYNRNHVDLIGNVGNIEIRSGKKDVAVISLATNRRYKDGEGNKQTETTWHQIVAFSPALVDLAKKHINKGDLLNVTAFLRTSKWEDADGKDRYSVELVAKSFGFLSPKRNGADDDAGDDDANS